MVPPEGESIGFHAGQDSTCGRKSPVADDVRRRPAVTIDPTQGSGRPGRLAAVFRPVWRDHSYRGVEGGFVRQ